MSPDGMSLIDSHESPDGQRAELRQSRTTGELYVFADRGRGTAGASAPLPLSVLERWCDRARDAALRFIPPEEAS